MLLMIATVTLAAVQMPRAPVDPTTVNMQDAKVTSRLARFKPARRFDPRAGRGQVDAAYRKALALEPTDPVQALALYRTTAEAGHPQAQLALGQIYLSGSLLPRDDAQALEWLQKAAAQDEPIAIYNLGYMYEHGLGTARDEGTAMALYRKAAEAGVAKAQFNLALLYGASAAAGDPELAYRWFAIASQTGIGAATARMAELEKRLTPEQVERARREAAAITVNQQL